MPITISHLSINVLTNAGPFGVDIAFHDGLNIISAENTSGKSTCLQAIIYALGLEKMLSPKREIPLPYAVRDYINVDGDDRSIPVISSHVLLEIRNDRGEYLTVKRSIKGEIDWRLIEAWHGPILSEPGVYAERSSFFVRDPGAAQREAGFHYFLADFIGWDLPRVMDYDGNFTKLYLESIFPMFFVEQKAGWSTIQGPFPTYLRIQDVGRRSTEFVLKLDAQEIRSKRQEISTQLSELNRRWSDALSAIRNQAAKLNARVLGIPQAPSADFTLDARVEILCSRNDGDVPLTQHLSEIKSRFEEIQKRGTPRVGEVAESLEIKLAEKENELDHVIARRESLFGERDRLVAEVRALEERLSSITSDLRKNKDTQKLQKMGSSKGFSISSGICPTCHQPVDSELLPPQTGNTMSIDANIALLDSQKRLYDAMLSNSKHKLLGINTELKSLSEQSSKIREEIRHIRNTLTSPDQAFSEATITEKITLKQEIASLSELMQMINEYILDFQLIGADYAKLKSLLSDISRDDFTPADKAKLGHLSAIVRGQLSIFGFNTFPVDAVSISGDNFRPQVMITRDDEIVEAELGFEMSASDAVRMKWAYLLSILEVSHTFSTNHLGILIFDEPRQQEANELSFEALVREAANCARRGAQVIFATSETPRQLAPAITGINVNFRRIEGLILKPMQ